MWTAFWGMRRGRTPREGAAQAPWRVVFARLGACVGVAAASGLLWWAVMPAPQNLLAIAFGGGWRDLYLLARGVVGIAVLAVSACLACFPHARSAFVCAMTRYAGSEEVQVSRYLDMFPRNKMPLLVSAVLGAASVVAGYALVTSWIRLMPGGEAVWAAGVLPMTPGWAAACVIAVCAGVVGCFGAIGCLPSCVGAAIGVGAVSLCALGPFSCGPDTVQVALSLLFGVQLMGAVAVGWRDVAPALQALVACELVPMLAVVSGAVACALRAAAPDTEMGAHRPFILLLAMGGCALATLGVRTARARRRRTEHDGVGAGRSCQGAAEHRGSEAPACSFKVPETYGLSERERSVLLGSLQGRSLAQLARELGVSRSTAGTYRLRAYTKLGVESLEDARELLRPGETREVSAPAESPAVRGDEGGAVALPTSFSSATPLVDRIAMSGGWVAWFMLAGVLLAPWCGSRAWLLADAWRTLPSTVLVAVTGYLVLGDSAPSRRPNRCAGAAGAVCTVLLLFLVPALPGGHMAVGELPVLFDFVLAAALVFGLVALAGQWTRTVRAFVPCACVAAGVHVASSMFASLYLAMIAVAACTLAMACVGCVAAGPVGGSVREDESARGPEQTRTAEPMRAARRGRHGEGAQVAVPTSIAGSVRADEPTCPAGDARDGGALPALDGIGFIPHGGQVIGLVGGLSAWGWGLYQMGAYTLVDAVGVFRVPPAVAASSAVACAFAGFLVWACRRQLRRAPRCAWLAAALAGAAALGCLWAVGGSGVAAPLAQGLVTVPLLVLAGAACDMLAAFRAAYRCASFGFAMPTLLLSVFAIWCCGPFIAVAAGGGPSDGGWVAAAVVAAGGALGAASLNSAWRTLHKRAALRRAGLQAVERALRKAGLTHMEARVAALLCAGRATREVAAALFIESSTVRSHTRRAYAKLAVHTRGELEVAAAALVREHAR